MNAFNKYILDRTETSTGRNALHLSVIMGDFKVSEYLLSCGINPHHKDDFGKLPIEYATNTKSPLYGLLYLYTHSLLGLMPLRPFIFEEMTAL